MKFKIKAAPYPETAPTTHSCLQRRGSWDNPFFLIWCYRLGNGSISSGEGLTFRGKGFIRLTGKYNYWDISELWNTDPENAIKKIFHKTIKNGGNLEELVNNYDVAMKASMYYWTIAKNEMTGNDYADRGINDQNIKDLTNFVKGSTETWTERRDLSIKVLTELQK